VGERRGDGTGSRDLFRTRAVERLHDRIESSASGSASSRTAPTSSVDPGDDFQCFSKPSMITTPSRSMIAVDRVGVEVKAWKRSTVAVAVMRRGRPFVAVSEGNLSLRSDCDQHRTWEPGLRRKYLVVVPL